MGIVMNDAKQRIIEIDLNDVLPNRFQPRIKFNEESIIELADSIKEHGVIQPIIVRPIGDKYEIIAGERRYKACVLAGLPTITSRVLDLNDKDSAEVALIENVQRKELTPIEEAISYKKLLDMGITQEQLAAKLGKSQSAIANKKRLLNLCDEVQEALMEEKISERHARSLLKLDSAKAQKDMLKRIISERLTVRKLDDEINNLLKDNSVVAEPIKDEVLTIPTGEISIKNKHIEVPLEKKEEEVIDISSLFEDIPLKSIKEENITNEEKSSNVENKNGEREIMNNDLLNGASGNVPEPVISTRTFGRFFDVEPDTNQQAPSNPIMNFDAQPLSSNTELSNPSSTNTPTGGSMFQGLMDNNAQQKDEFIDEKTFNNFLDPSYIDGQKQQEINNSGVIDASVFAKFLDPEYDLSNNNDPAKDKYASNQPKVSTMSFADYLSGDTKANDVPVEEAQTSKFTPIVDGFSGVTSQTVEPVQQVTPIAQVEPEVKPVEITTPTVDVSPIEIEPAKKAMPDLLAPMGVTPVNVVKETNGPIYGEEVSNFEATSTIPSVTAPEPTVSLTPDASLVSTAPVEEVKPEPTPVEEAPNLGFITATSIDSSATATTSPIIDNPEMSTLLSPTPAPTPVVAPVVEEKVEEVTPVVETTVNPNIDTMENRPIIVTDYNKQYDPLLPKSLQPTEKKVDFRQVLNMIRELNDKIEGLGFTIDTEEYDLEDIYQVVFKINKQ